jgi:two-component system nitrate/nitrite response regulator NarL
MRRRPAGAILVGPNSLLREGLIRVLSEAQFRILASVANVSDLAANGFQQYERILLIIECGSDPSSVLPQIACFKEQYPRGRVAVLGGHHRPADMVAAFQAGANVYFDSEEACDAFIKALELVMLGETMLPPELLSYVRDTQGGEAPPKTSEHATETTMELRQMSQGEWPQLSSRESCILGSIVEGASNKVIARKIDIAEATVKVHVKAILRKIRARNRTQAAIWAMNHASHLCHADNSGHPPKDFVPLPPTPRQVSLEPLAEQKTGGGAEDPTKTVAIADVSSLAGRGLNGQSS